MSTVGDYFDATQFQGINEGIGTSGIVISLEGTPADGSYANMHGDTGIDGPQGDPGTPFRWQGDVADQVALGDLIPILGPAMAGFAYRVLSDNSVMFWTGAKFVSFLDAFGALGPTGQVSTLSIGTVTTGAVGSPLIVSITGSPPSQTLNLTVPRGGAGQKGIQGPPGPISGSTDFDSTVTMANGMSLLWNTSTSKWTPTQWPGFRGPWSVVETQSWDNPTSGFIGNLTNATANTPVTLATINIPAQPIRWRPYIAGGASIAGTATDFSTRFDLEVRNGSTTGEILARGPGSTVYIDWYAQLRPFFASSFAAGSTVGTIAPSTAVTLYLIVNHAVGPSPGGDTFNYKRQNAQIIVWAMPVVTP